MWSRDPVNPALYFAKLGCVEARTLCASGPHPALPGAGLGLPLSSEAECFSEDNKMGVLLKGQQRTAEPQVPGLFSVQEPHVRRMESPCTPHFGWGNRSGRSTLNQHLMPRVFDYFIPGSQGGELTVFRGPAEWSQSLETPKFAFLGREHGAGV